MDNHEAPFRAARMTVAVRDDPRRSSGNFLILIIIFIILLLLFLFLFILIN
jgi:hypothetical protein